MNKPQRPYEIEIHIGAGNIKEIISSLAEIERCISENKSNIISNDVGYKPVVGNSIVKRRLKWLEHLLGI